MLERHGPPSPATQFMTSPPAGYEYVFTPNSIRSRELPHAKARSSHEGDKASAVLKEKHSNMATPRTLQHQTEGAGGSRQE